MTDYQTELALAELDNMREEIAGANAYYLAEGRGRTARAELPGAFTRMRELRETLAVLDPDDEFGWK